MATLIANGTVSLLGSQAAVTPLGGDLHTVHAFGTWGSGTLTVEVTVDGANWIATDLAFTSNGFGSVYGRFAGIRGTLAGATSPALTVVAL